MQDLPVDLTQIQAAAQRIAPFIHKTPLLSCGQLSTQAGCILRMKAEHLQKSGSFKLRGALNTLLLLTAQEREAGVVAFSSGNHAQGVALAARLLGIRATIVMPADAPPVKLQATRGYGAEIILYDRAREDREAIARAVAIERGAVLVPPFDDVRVIAGQGTIGLELAEQWPDLEVVVVPVGGGGLISGIGLALKHILPHVVVVGVEPARADDARRSLEGGTIVHIPPPATVADGVATTHIGIHPFAIMKEVVDTIVTVDEEEILDALRWILTRSKQVVEPTGALATAAVLTGRYPLQGRRVVSLLCGGNLDLRVLRMLSGEAGDGGAPDLAQQKTAPAYC